MRQRIVPLSALVVSGVLLAGCGGNSNDSTSSATSAAGKAAASATSAAGDAAKSATSAAGDAASKAGPAASSAGSSASSMGSQGMSNGSSAMSSMSHEHKMDGGPAPAGIKPASNPKYPVGSKVTLTADHMMGMKGAPATIVGAYQTHVYAVDYTPTDGGKKVTNHKWVVQQELQGVGDKKLAPGDTATMTADHMPGMKGAKATIVSETDQTAYMVNYDMGGMTMKNHKWVVESEIQPAK